MDGQAANADTAPAPFAFTERTGSTVQLPTNAKSTDYLAIFLDEVLGLIVEETNGYVPIGTSKIIITNSINTDKHN